MSDASFQRSRVFDVSTQAAPRRKLPAGYGLVGAAAVSIGLWAGLIWIAGLLFA